MAGSDPGGSSKGICAVWRQSSIGKIGKRGIRCGRGSSVLLCIIRDGWVGFDVGVAGSSVLSREIVPRCCAETGVRLCSRGTTWSSSLTIPVLSAGKRGCRSVSGDTKDLE